MKLVLILTSGHDPAVAMVTRHLADLGQPYFIFDIQTFHETHSLNLHIERGAFTFSIKTLGGDVVVCRREDVACVWNRMKTTTSYYADSPAHEHYFKETLKLLSWLMACLQETVFHLPSFLQELETSNKFLQLMQAAEVGLTTPATYVGNSAVAALSCLPSVDWYALKPLYFPCIYTHPTLWERLRNVGHYWQHREKLHAVGMSLKHFSKGLTQIVLDTKRITAQQLTDYEVFPGPRIIQPFVPKAYELRITIVGNEVFACRISQPDQTFVNDFRWHMDAMPHDPYELPEDIRQKLFALLERQGLSFGCIDMIVTPDGEYVFLENNVNGEWAWIEDRTGMPISMAICRLLTQTKISAQPTRAVLTA